MKTTHHDLCSATPRAIRTRVDYAAGVLVDVTGRKLAPVDDAPPKDRPDPYTMSHWRYLEDEDGRQYRVSALVLLDNAEEGSCVLTVEVGSGNRSATARLTRSRATDEAIVRHLVAIVEFWEEISAQESAE